MAAKSKKPRYSALRPHTARILKLAEFPMHVNGAYMDDPDRIATLSPERKGRA